MTFYLFALFSYSILIAAVIGLVRLRRISPLYYPLILYTVLATVNEGYSYIIVSSFGISNNANNNVYVLLEAFIITWQFYRWGLFAKKKGIYYCLQGLFLLAWCLNFWYVKNVSVMFHHYRIYYAFVLVLLSLTEVNRAIYSNSKAIFKNTRFLVSAGLVLLYTCKIITELFWLYGIENSNPYLYAVYSWFGYINLIINLLFILAVLWIPKKPRYITFI